MNDLTRECEDFTISGYQHLVRLALQKYPQASYQDIPWGGRFILWRHDVDLSLNRSVSLARIEAEEGLKATYFINPHSEFYNLFEAGQASLVREIIRLGHDIGLHFDAGFYGELAGHELHELVMREAAWIEQMFEKRPFAFSFHNPVASHLRCENDTYGGLLNCYSRKFKTEIPYCSDSNGYWRFRRLYDVLESATDPCLQVLTHPGWWQELPIPARRRVLRCIYGRARATMRRYDETVSEHGRVNQQGPASTLRVLADSVPKAFEICDFLWNEGHFPTLFVELWRLHEAQVNRLCKAVLRKEWRVPARDVNAFFGQEGLGVDGFRLFRGLFGESWQALAGLDADDFSKWVDVRNQLVHGKGSFEGAVLEQGCAFVCEAMARIAEWGLAQPLAYDGLAHLGSIGLPTVKAADGSLSDRLEEVAGEIPAFPNKRWEAFKASLGVAAPAASGEA